MTNIAFSSKYTSADESNRISITRIEDAKCPFKYYKNYVEKPREERDFISIELAIGQHFHSYVERYLRRLEAKGTEISSTNSIRTNSVVDSFTADHVQSNRLKSPYKIVISSKPLSHYLDRLRRVADNFNQVLRSMLVGHTILEVERRFELQHKNLYIRGRHDLITVSPSGHVQVWDWKSGKKRSSPESRMQLAVYSLYAARKYPDHDVIGGRAVYLRDTVQTLSVDQSQCIPSEILTYFHDWRQKLNELDHTKTMRSRLCDWCGWQSSCPTYSPNYNSTYSRPARRYSSYYTRTARARPSYNYQKEKDDNGSLIIGIIVVIVLMWIFSGSC